MTYLDNLEYVTQTVTAVFFAALPKSKAKEEDTQEVPLAEPVRVV